MAVNIYTEWGKLKEVVVGDCVNINSYNVDLSFRYFFGDNIRDEFLKNNITLQTRLIEQRKEDLDAVAKSLEELGIRVHRPRKLEKIESFKTPHFEDWTRPIDNPRDQVLIYADEIIETSCLWRARYFENDLFKDIFKELFDRGAHWVSSPRPELRDENFDLSYLRKNPNQDVDWQYYDSLTKSFEIMFDGAQCLKFGKDIIMNISNENHRLGAKWLQRHLRERAQVHTVELTDHHIDGMFMPLRPGLLLCNYSSMKDKISLLPKPLQKWDHIYVPGPSLETKKEAPQLASANILVNVLPLSESMTAIFASTKKEALPLEKTLRKAGQEVIILPLRHSRLFGGGLHCATLDLIRDEVCESYF